MSLDVVGVAGLGLLGRGITACLLAHGLKVVAFSREETEFAVARETIATAMADLVAHAGLPSSIQSDWQSRYTEWSSLEPFSACSFVIESIVEDFAAKTALFEELERIVGATVPIASNTSAIPITSMQANRRFPARFLGVHWAEPAYATRFLEIIRGAETSSDVVAIATALARQIGKEPCVVGQDLPGFIANRLGYAMYREALHLLEQGVGDVETIDTAFRNSVGLWASICGPFRWMDLTGGPALYARAMQGVLPTLSTSAQLPSTMQEMMARDAKGIVDGRGFYSYRGVEGSEWLERYHRHVWAVKKQVDSCLPLPRKASGGTES